MPTIFMLIGVPACGKSTFVNEHMGENDAYISSDKHIEEYAVKIGKTYSEVFSEYASTAMSLMNQDLTDAINSGKNIIWDQTNLTVKSRLSKLAKIPSNYDRVAVVFETPDKDEHSRRLSPRPGKTIPEHIISNMISQFEYPSDEEGYSDIYDIDAYGNRL